MELGNNNEETANNKDSLISEISNEIENSQSELDEISILLEQSEGQVEKLAEKNAIINMHLQKTLKEVDKLSISEIKTAYNAAMESQQRLVMMRSQLDKLNSDKVQINRYLEMLKKVNSLFTSKDIKAWEEPQTGMGKYAAAEMMIKAQEAERQRLSQNIHDGPAQTLSNFILQTEIALRLFDIDQFKAKEELSALKASASNTFQQIRDFIFDLRPMMLDDLGLVPTIKRYTDAFREKSGKDINIQVSGKDRRVESYLEVMVFRAMQELMNYSIQVSEATVIDINLDMGLESIRLVVENNGKGFTQQDYSSEKTIGLKMINERVEMLGGYFNIDNINEKLTSFSLNVPMKTEVESN